MLRMPPSPYRPVIEGLFRVVDPDAKDCDVILRPVQAQLDASWTTRNIIPKSRRHGVSTYIIWRFIAKCLTERNRRCMLVSHEKEATSRLFSIAQYTVSNLKGAPAVVSRNNRNEMVFAKTNSTFWIGTAGSENLGHGDTITDLHWSEAAHTKGAEELRKGLFPAADAGEITVESTGNGVGNWFHRSVVRAAEGHGFSLHFFPYTEHPDSWLQFRSPDDRETFLANLRPEYNEPELAEAGIRAEVLQWRRDKIDVLFEGNLKDFTEQYPRTLDECFQATGHSLFPRINYVPTERWERRGRMLWALQGHPDPTRRYAVGADVGGGVGRDNSVAEVIDLDTLEQVAEWVSNGLDPDLFGLELAHLGGMFNNAYVNVEQNNHGLVTVRALRDRYPHHLLHQGRPRASQDTEYETRRLMNYGTLVNQRVKGSIIGGLRAALRTECVIHSELLKSELGSFVEKEDGRMEAEEGCYDDRVMALAHAVACVERASMALAPVRPTVRPRVDPFSWEAIFGEELLEGTLPFSEGKWA